MDKHEDAIINFTKAIMENPKCVKAYVGRGRSKFNMLKEFHYTN